MKTTPEGWEYSSECYMIKDNFGTVAVHKDDIVEYLDHYVLIDRYVGNYCLYYLYRPAGIQLNNRKRQSILSNFVDKFFGIQSLP